MILRRLTVLVVLLLITFAISSAQKADEKRVRPVPLKIPLEQN
jgi:hypothetical protein